MQKHSIKEFLPLISEAFSRHQSVTIPVKGVSMRPTLSQGDGVTLTDIEGHSIHRGDILLYTRPDGSYILHRVVRVHGEFIDFCGDAQIAVEKNIPVRSVIAFVSAYDKDGITHSLDDIYKEGRRRLAIRPLRAVKYTLSRSRTSNLEALRFIGKYLRPYVVSILVMCFASMLAALSGLGMAMVSGHIIDKAVSGDMRHFQEWFYLLFALLVLAVVSNIVYSQLRVRASGKMKIHIRDDLFSSLLSKSYLSLQQIHSGELLNRFTADTQVVVDNSTTIIPQVVSIFTKLIGGLAFMMMVEPLFTGIMIAVGIAAGCILQFCSRYYKTIHKQCQETEGKTRSFLQESVENLLVIKSFDSFKGIKKILNDCQQVNFKMSLKRNWYANIGNTAVYAGFTFAYYAGLAWGILRVAGIFGAGMSIGIFASFLQIMEQVRAPFRSASGILPQFYSMCASAERLLEIKNVPSEEVQPLPVSEEVLYDTMTAICLDHVDFAYSRKNTVFKDASCRFNKGEFTAIVGGSGIGKSTIIKILLAFLPPQNGEIFVRTPTARVPVTSATRGLFAYVPQGNMVLSGTLYQNLTLGNENVTDEELRRVLDLACLTETVAALPRGLMTPIGERGVGLSEGQIQRLAIARALLSKSPVLLLDECTSSLDAHTEKQLLANIRSLKDKTIIFITHREAVVNQADSVLMINQKQIVSCDR